VRIISDYNRHAWSCGVQSADKAPRRVNTSYSEWL